MHKDCIIYTPALKNETQLISLLEILKPYHFCKITYIVTSNSKLTSWIQNNRTNYGFAIDIITLDNNFTGTAFLNALPYTQNDDVLYIATNAIPGTINIDALFIKQAMHQADATICDFDNSWTLNSTIEKEILVDIKNEKVLVNLFAVIFKPSFLTLHFAQEFDIIKDYVVKFKLLDQNICIT